jgi:hypothetical protein
MAEPQNLPNIFRADDTLLFFHNDQSALQPTARILLNQFVFDGRVEKQLGDSCSFPVSILSQSLADHPSLPIFHVAGCDCWELPSFPEVFEQGSLGLPEDNDGSRLDIMSFADIAVGESLQCRHYPVFSGGNQSHGGNAVSQLGIKATDPRCRLGIEWTL